MKQKWYEDAKLFSQRNNTVFEYGFDATFHVEDRNPVSFYHYHDFYEMVFYLGEAPLQYRFNDQIYDVQKGDIILCDMFQPHVYMCDDNTNYARFSIGISPKLLSAFSSDPDYALLFQTGNDFCPILRTDILNLSKYLSLIAEYRRIESRTETIGIRRAMVLLLLAYVYEDCAASIKTTSRTGSTLVDDLISYIEAHCTEGITLEQLAEHTHFSVSYITRVFRRHTGQTLVQYITEKRILKARQMLEEGLPLNEIAERTGFSDYSYFYKCFVNSEHMTPSEYRKKLQDK